MSQYQRRSPKRSQQFSTARPPMRNSGKRQPKKAYIHPSRFIQAAQEVAAVPFVPTHSFADFQVHPLIQQNLHRMGFERPSPIQDQTIPIGLRGQDVVGIAHTGTGKTAAFAVPILHRLLTEPGSQALILAPTRELAGQIDQQCRDIAKGGNIASVLLIGGVSMGPQLRDLKQHPRLIIGTPGRIKDHLTRRSLVLNTCNIVALDEVDRMLDMGFVHDIRRILGQASQTKQSFYFSATLDARVTAIIETFSHDAVHVSVKSGETTANVEQNVVPYNAEAEKIDKLHQLLSRHELVKVLVFDDTQRSVEKLSKALQSRGFAAESMHGGKSQSKRQRVLAQFKEGRITVLVATDVAARGLDVADITHVINYSLPQTYEDYVHRIGRAGRAGKTGHALTFIVQ